MDEKHKRLRFSPQMRKIFFPFQPIYSRMRKRGNQKLKISAVDIFPTWIVVPEEQHEL